MFAGRKFQFHPMLTLVSLLGVSILIMLGAWQMHRLEWKNTLIEKVETRINQSPVTLVEAAFRWRSGEDMEYMPVHVKGVFGQVGEANVFGTLDGRTGAYIFTALRSDMLNETKNEVVYVNRGFLPDSLRESKLSTQTQLQDDQYIEGLFRTAEKRTGLAAVFRPADRPDDNQWYVRDPLLFATYADLDVSSFYIDSFAVDGIAWPKGGTTRLAFSNRHFEYALTWFGLALTLIGIWLVFSLQKKNSITK